MMISKTLAAMASLLLLLPTASASLDVGGLGDPSRAGGNAVTIVGGAAAIADSSTPRLLDATLDAPLAATTPEGEKKGIAEPDDGSDTLGGLNDATHPGLRGLSKPDCNPKPTSSHPKPTNPGPAMSMGKGGSPSNPKVSKAKAMDYGKGKGQVQSKGSKAGGPSKAKKAKTGKGGCGGSGCGTSKSKQSGKTKSKGKVKDSKQTSKGPKGSKMGPKSSKGCTGCPPPKPSQPKPTPPKPTKPTVKCSGAPATMAPSANVEIPPDDTCERQCMQWVSQNCVVLDELGDIMEDHCVVPFPFDDDLFGRSLGAAAEGEAADVVPVTSKPSTVQEKIDYHRRMAHVYQQVLSLID